MNSERKFWGLLLLVSAAFIIFFTFFLMRIIYPLHVDQMKRRARETVSHLQFVLPYLTPLKRQEYLESVARKADDLSYLLLMNMNGDAIAHSNPVRVGLNFYESGFRQCIETGKRIEQIYIRDADNPSSRYHGEKTIDILEPYYTPEGRINGAVNVGISLAIVEKARFNYIIVSATGTILWIMFISGFAFTHLRTMSLKRRSDTALRESEEKYRFLVENSHDIPYTIDVNGNITFIGPQIKRYRLEPEGITGTPIQNYINQEDYPVVSRLLSTSVKSEQASDAIFRLADTGCGEVWLEAKGGVIFSDDGALTGFSGILRDVTQRLKTEKELADTRALLITAMDQFPAGLVVADAGDGRILHYNSEALNIRGLTGDELLNIPYALHSEKWQIYNSDGTLADPSTLPLTRAIKTGEKYSNIELLMKNPDKGLRTILVNAAPVTDSREKIIAGIAVLTDITDRKALEEQLRQSQKMDVIGQLVGGIAHDFNNMLGGIIGSAEMLSIKIDETSPLKTYIETILKGAERAADLTKNLLAYSRKGKLVSTVIDIHEPIREAIALLERTIDRRIDIKTALNAKNSSVTGDPSLLQNAFMNLSLNARDAMPDGGTLTFTTCNTLLDDSYCRSHPALEPGDYIEIDVSDTGRGMSKDVIHRIFEPFFTTKEFGKGTGLGLAAVYGTVKEHKGEIIVYSEPGRGTLFKIFIPVERSTSVALTAGNDEMLVRGSGCILLIDDEAIIRNIVHAQLSHLGYDVLLAGDGEAGVELFLKEKNRISLVIIDLVMPKISGQETLKRILDIDPGTKAIFASGFNYYERKQELIKLGAAGFIQKPFQLAKLSRIISETLKS